MGACFMDQIVNNYLSKNKLDEGTNKINNTNKVFRRQVKLTLQWNNIPGMSLRLHLWCGWYKILE
jgi:hypothetical protein